MPPWVRPIGVCLFAIGAALLVYLFASGAVAGRSIERRAAVVALGPAYEGEDRRAPDFTLHDQRGRPVRLSRYRGKVVVLNFWTITCGPCIEEIPSVEDLRRILAEDDDVALLTVSVDRDWATVRRLFPRGTRLPVLFDPDRRIVTGKFGTRLFPETWLIDKEGIIRARFDGARDWSSGVAIGLIRSLR